MSNTPQTKTDINILGAFAGVVGLLSIALYFSGWIYRWAYFGYFRLPLTSIDFLAQSFFFVPIQVFLGSPCAFFQAVLAMIVAFFLVRATLWLLLLPNTASTAPPSGTRSLLTRCLQRLKHLWLVRNLHSIAQIFPSTLVKDMVIVGWILAVLFWLARWQGVADARQASINETSLLPVITLIHPDKDLGIGRHPKISPDIPPLDKDPSLNKTRIIGDVGLFLNLRGKEIKAQDEPPQNGDWHLLIASKGWLYLVKGMSKTQADSGQPPLVLAVREGGGEQMMILSPSASGASGF